jgi:hypothetical protein
MGKFHRQDTAIATAVFPFSLIQGFQELILILVELNCVPVHVTDNHRSVHLSQENIFWKPRVQPWMMLTSVRKLQVKSTVLGHSRLFFH